MLSMDAFFKLKTFFFVRGFPISYNFHSQPDILKANEDQQGVDVKFDLVMLRE